MLTGENGGGGEEEEPEKKSKERREKDRKALRMRRINSLKRQINIKEKMLEVQLIHFLSTLEFDQPLTFLIVAYTCLPHLPVLGSFYKCK